MNSDQGNAAQNSSDVSIERAGEAPDSVAGLAGRELDVAMAQLMGWKRVHTDRDAGDDRKDVAWMLHHKSGVLKGSPYTWGNGSLYDRTFAKWSPSTDIAAAMEVESEMARRGFLFTLHRFSNGKWAAIFYRLEPSDDPAFIEDDSKEIVICRAALQATASASALSTTVEHQGSTQP